MECYKTSEKAFYDIWNEFGKPEEINDSYKAFEFLTRLQENTEGLYIADHLSGTNYDHVDNITYEDPYNAIFWKDFNINPTDNFTMEIFGGLTYIYSLCKINKLKFINIGNHLFILIMPYVSSDRELEKHLGIKGLKSEEWVKEYNIEDFTIEYKFLINDEIHRCISHILPFYSFLLQPKENDCSTIISTKLLLAATLEESKQRIIRVEERLLYIDIYSYDDLCEMGNTLRRIVEYLLKYYMFCKGIGIPKDSYGNNMIGDLSKALKGRDDDLRKLIDSSLIINANELSHDSGMEISKELLDTLLSKVRDIYLYIEDKLYPNNKRS